MKMIAPTDLIITSLLDTDIYKFYMQQAVFHHYSATPVVAEFHCRNDDLLGEYAPQIIEQIQAMRSLKLSDTEYHYLVQTGHFQSDYLAWLKTFRYQPEQVAVTQQSGQLVIKITGNWLDIILWEVPLLALISELIQRSRNPDIGVAQALQRLDQKLTSLTMQQHSQIPLTDLRFVEFGTRRRFSFEVQQAIIEKLQQYPPYFAGTSNVHLARQLNLNVVGTQAHEWFQAHQQLTPHLANSQKKALQVWLQEYPQQLGIALTDCISMDAFLADFSADLAEQYQGLRHDSGDAICWGEKALQHYQDLNIDPRSKTLVFSDSLNFSKMLHIYQHFYQRCKMVFGIGTFLSCDIPPVRPLNIVIKLTQCNGRPVTKISDSPGKIINQNPEFMRKLRQAFNLPLEN